MESPVASPTRRSFVKTAATLATAGCLGDLGFLLPISHAAASDTTINPNDVRLRPELGEFLRLVRSTPRDKCVAAVIRELQEGLSYQDFLSALFLLGIEHGDPHQVAQVYAAHRISSEARTEERLLPLFWVLDRIKLGFEEEDRKAPAPLKGPFPTADRAADVFHESMTKLDPETAERAVIALARARGPRQAMAELWQYGARRVAGTLGHHPIVVTNTWRTLEAMGWQHAEPVLRYIARSLPNHEADRTHAPNLERVRQTVPRLPADWAADEHSREATLAMYALLRSGDADATCDLICQELASGKIKAGAVWDALHLVAADLVFRYKTGGMPIGGSLIHAVTTTNALRYGFDCCGDDRTRLLMLLQGVGALGDVFIRPAQKEGQLRNMDLLDLRPEKGEDAPTVQTVFATLPFKDARHVESDPGERRASDAACRLAMAVLADPANAKPFQQAARSLLCAKASIDPHDVKYPAAAFEDAYRVAPEWRAHVLASSVHALHGSNSKDSRVLVQAREALS